MDVKLAFINVNIEEKVYIEQLEGFLLSKNKDYMCKLKKTLYGLKLNPLRAWYSILDKYIQQ